MNMNDALLNAYKKIKKPDFQKITKEEINESVDVVKSSDLKAASSGKKSAENSHFEKFDFSASVFSSESKERSNFGKDFSNSGDDYKAKSSFHETQSNAPFSRIFESSSASSNVEKKAMDENAFLKVPFGYALEGKGGEDSSFRRVAKFLILIGEENASTILKKLPQEHIESIVRELASIRNVTKEEADSIFAEFHSLLEKSKEGGGLLAAKKILEKAFGSVRAERMIEKAVPFGDEKPFAFLKNAEKETVYALLKDESSAVRAMVLSFLEPKLSASIINSLDVEEKKDVILRLARIKELNPLVVQRVNETMKEKLSAFESREKDVSLDGRSALASILRHMDKYTEDKIIGNLSEEDEELGASLKKMLFTTDDVINADDRFIQNVLRKMSDADIAFLVAGKSENFRLKILQNVSLGRSEDILEEENLRLPMRKSDVDKITNDFFNVLRSAYEDGRLIIKNRDGEDKWVM